MNKKHLISMLLVIICTIAVLFSGCSSDIDDNILKLSENSENNSFGYDTVSELEDDWTLNADEGSSLTDVFSIEDGDVVINTTESGWAQLSQTVNLKAKSYYKVEYTFSSPKDFKQFGSSLKASDGLYVSFAEDKDFNYGEGEYHNYNVNPSIQHAEFYFKAKNANNTTITLNVGSEEGPTSIEELTIHSFKVTKVNKTIVSDAGGDYFTFDSDYFGDPSLKNIPYVVLGGIAMLLFMYVAYVLLRRNLGMESLIDSKPNKVLEAVKSSKWLGFAIVAGCVLLVRLVLNLVMTIIATNNTYVMFGQELDALSAQGLFIGKFGTPFLYSSLASFCENNSYLYMAPVQGSPIQLFIAGLAGLIGSAFGTAQTELLATSFFIKLFASLADVGTALIIYIIAKKKVGNVSSLIMAVAYGLLPLTFAISGSWGLAESFTVFFAVLTFYYVLENKYFGVVLAYLGVVLTSWTGLILAPMIIFYTVRQFINKPKLRLAIIGTAIASVVVVYLMNLPFEYNLIKENGFFTPIVSYWNLLVKDLVYTINAFNFQGLLGNNGRELTVESIVVTIMFVVFVLGVLGFAYFKNKDRMELLILSSVFVLMMYEFGNNMTPAVQYVALSLMMIYGITNKDKRVLIVFALLSTIMFVNVSASIMLTPYGDFISNKAFSVTFSTFNLLIVLYYLYVVFDIVASKKRKSVKPMLVSYPKYVKNIALQVQKHYYNFRIKLRRN